MTHPHKERFARENLLRQGFVVYQPLILKRVSHARRVQHLPRALFPGYLFVAAEPETSRWRALGGTLGVRSFIRIGNKPALMSGRFIAELRAREIDGVISRPPVPFQPGDTIRVVRGPFEGTVAKILNAGERDRVAVLLELLHRDVVANLDIGVVVPYSVP